MGTPTRLTNGLSTQVKNSLMGDYPLPDPIHTGSSPSKDVVTYFNDFLQSDVVAAYSISGGGAMALGVGAAGVGGTNVLTPASATACAVTRAATAFQFVAGNRFWMVHRLYASAVAGVMSAFWGVNTANAAITADGLYFRKAASQLNVDLVSVINGTTTVLAAAITSMAASTYVDVGVYYDGVDLKVYVNDVIVARITNVTIGATNAFTLTNAYVSPVYQITPVGTENLNIDYILVATEVTR